jgi:hypothetical protein
VAGEVVRVEGNQRVASAHLITLGDLGREALALQVHGVEADVHHHLDAVRRGQCDGVVGLVQLCHPAVAGRDQQFVDGVD